ncbi:Type VI secretion system (T6SS), amidase effector protein 4 [Chryseobacterium taichungense]|uniref:Type VI secretion system (T6SS), amidase effector protein 4 n=1 Tax=Chryseobacterium taichungense TaxID=295069 RepID=A0A1H8D335_9FLAO|nr:T6SS effector amidase Tae4 family protein [Chryseobacterium taichungense]SEN01008.1 Type VI secretion system (T6SS), amidase effector protein 4 [Chryseobacterium taichungense]
MSIIKPLGIPKVKALGLKNINGIVKTQSKSLSIKYISCSKDDKLIYLVFNVIGNNLENADASIYVDEIDSMINDEAVPKTKVSILKTGAKRITLSFDKNKDFRESFFDDGNLFQATIACDGLSANSEEFKLLFPNKQTLWEKIYAKYPKPYSKKPCNENYYNQCAIRMSISLLGAGIKLNGVKNKTNPGGQIKCSHGHILGAYNLKEFIIDENLFGKAQEFNGTTDNNVLNKVSKKRGILFFEAFEEDNTDDGTDNPNRSSNYRHIEVWDGKKLLSGFDNQMFKAKLILFWEIK